MTEKTSPWIIVSKWPLERIIAWLDGMVIGEPIGGEFFNWELFAYNAANKARDERSLEWARLALMVYDALEKRADPSYEFSLRLSEMTLRSWFIVELGQRAGDTVLDPEFMVAWFRSVAPLPIEEAARLSSEFRDHPSEFPIETLRKLGRIKNALNPLRFIRDQGKLEGYPELEKWFELWPQLP